MGQVGRQGSNDEGSVDRTIQVVRFPTTENRVISCPMECNSGCKICTDGYYEVEGELWVNIQHPHVIQYIRDNLMFVSLEYNRLFGTSYEFVSEGMLKLGWTTFRVDSPMGSMWICVNLVGNVRHFYNEGGLKKWLALEK